MKNRSAILIHLILSLATLHAQGESIQAVSDKETMGRNFLHSFIMARDMALDGVGSGKFHLGGWVQASYQYGEKYATNNVGADNTFEEDHIHRIGLRAARLRAQYADKLFAVFFQLDIIEKGITLRDAFLRLNEPWLNSFSLEIGATKIPFGKEVESGIYYLEAENKALVINTFAPMGRDIAAKLTYTLPKKCWFDYLTASAAIVGGNGLNADTDNRKNGIFKIQGARSFDNITAELGVSAYVGSNRQATKRVYRMSDNRFVCDSTESNYYAYAPKQASDFTAQLTWRNGWGESTIRGEYINGTQPGTLSSSRSINSGKLSENIPANDTYIRPFNGGVVYLIHSLRDKRHTFSVRYDWYNPNTAVGGNRIGETGSYTGETDISTHTIGANYFFRITRNIRMSGHYEFVHHEKTTHVATYATRRPANLFTAKVQAMF